MTQFFGARFFLWSSLLAVSGCSSAEPSAPDDVGQVQGAIVVDNWPSLPLCTILNRGGVYYVKTEGKLVYCDGGNYRPLTLPASTGHDGVSWLVSMRVASSLECPTAGVVVQVGPDADHDGQLDAVTSSTPICNGAPGPAGHDGVAGPEGSDGQDGQNGDPGEMGSSGLTSLVLQTPEPAGPNCANGGTKIQSGLDANGNGTLDAAEVSQTSYVCASINTVESPPVSPSCPAGMLRIDRPHSTLCFTKAAVGSWDNTAKSCDESFRAGLCTLTQWREAICEAGVQSPGRVWLADSTGAGSFLTATNCSSESLGSAFYTTLLFGTCCLEWPQY